MELTRITVTSLTRCVNNGPKMFHLCILINLRNKINKSEINITNIASISKNIVYFTTQERPITLHLF